MELQTYPKIKEYKIFIKILTIEKIQETTAHQYMIWQDKE
jgi:hypothetical protein